MNVDYVERPKQKADDNSIVNEMSKYLSFVFLLFVFSTHNKHALIIIFAFSFEKKH